jgi:uncharacterized protein YecE (DUF72 family)
MNVFLGCSGWSYDEWVGYLYETKRESKLKTYSSIFGTAEIDSTFYAMPSKGLVFGWLKHSPDDFIFTAKIPQTITHKMKLSVDENLERELYEFLSLMSPLNTKGKLGCLLIQLPPKLKFVKNAVEDFYRILPKDYRYCVEFRNKTWMSEESFTLLKKYNLGYTIVDEPLLPPEVHLTSDIAYFRWHGHGSWQWYDYHYSGNELAMWIPKIKEVSKKAKRVFGYFNNHFHGYAPENCLDVLKMLGISAPAQDEVRERIKKKREGKENEGLTLERYVKRDVAVSEYLKNLMDEPRLKRAHEIRDALLRIEKMESDFIRARVKDYFCEIDAGKKTIRHDCDDWSRQLKNKSFCKHLGKLFLSCDEEISIPLLKDITMHTQKWNFEFGKK